MAAVLVVVDEVLQLVGVDHDVEATDLSQSELLRVHTRETHLVREGGGGEIVSQEAIEGKKEVPYDSKT